MKERPILFSGPMVNTINAGKKTQTRRVVKQLRDDQGREFIYRDGKVWASMTPEELAPLSHDPPRSVFGGEAICDGILWYTPIVVGAGRKGEGSPLVCPYGSVGDRLWVRESFTTWDDGMGLAVLFKSDRSAWHDPRPDADYPQEVWIRCDYNPLDHDLLNPVWKPSIHMPRWASRITLEITEVRVERLHDITEEDARAEGFPLTWQGEHYDPPTPEQDSWQSYGKASFFLLWSKINGPESYDANPWVWVVSFKVIPKLVIPTE